MIIFMGLFSRLHNPLLFETIIIKSLFSRSSPRLVGKKISGNLISATLIKKKLSFFQKVVGKALKKEGLTSHDDDQKKMCQGVNI